MKTKVLLADGRKILREGLALLLGRHADLHVVGEADDGQAAIRLVKAVAAHVVVLNSGLSTRTVAEQVKALVAVRKGLRVIVVTLHPSVQFVRETLAAGAAGCLAKDSASQELVEAIRAVASGKLYISPKIADVVVAGLLPAHKRLPVAAAAPAADARAPAISPREREILARIADGQTTKEIAHALKVGSKTIETHRRRLMIKLNRHSVAELTKYAVLEGITSLESAP
jgi:DNA-binding NarL/FixJ family response regulator